MMVAAQTHGPAALVRVKELNAILSELASQSEITQARRVNEYFNRQVVFQEDASVWGVEDYWTSPIELLVKGRGDCEDYAIAKYFSLVALGVPLSKLRLVYVQAQIGAVMQAHLVLAHYATSGSDPMILDNLVTEVRLASQRPDLVPVFSFNSEGLWQGVGAQSAGDPLLRLSRWRGVMGKVLVEGFTPMKTHVAVLTSGQLP